MRRFGQWRFCPKRNDALKRITDYVLPTSVKFVNFLSFSPHLWTNGKKIIIV